MKKLTLEKIKISKLNDLSKIEGGVRRKGALGTFSTAAIVGTCSDSCPPEDPDTNGCPWLP